MMGPFEYRSVWLLRGGIQNHDNNYASDLPQSYPDRIAQNIPTHEVDGWSFVCMVNSENGLFRRQKVS